MRKAYLKQKYGRKLRLYFCKKALTTPIVNIDIITGMNWDYTFTNSYSVKRRGVFYVSAKAVHAFNAGGKSECRVAAGAMYEHKLHLNTISDGKLSAEPIK